LGENSAQDRRETFGYLFHEREPADKGSKGRIGHFSVKNFVRWEEKEEKRDGSNARQGKRDIICLKSSDREEREKFGGRSRDDWNRGT